MSQFKRGDVVVVVAKANNGPSHRNGSIGIVTRISSDYAVVQIISPSPEFEGIVRSCGADGWGFYDKHLEFITHAEDVE